MKYLKAIRGKILEDHGVKSTHVRGYGDGLRCLLISLPSSIGLHFTVKRLARTHTHTQVLNRALHFLRLSQQLTPGLCLCN